MVRASVLMPVQAAIPTMNPVITVQVPVVAFAVRELRHVSSGWKQPFCAMVRDVSAEG